MNIPSRLLLKHNESIPDTRCEICRQHKFLVYDLTGRRHYLHSIIDRSLKNTNVSEWIHWWDFYPTDLYTKYSNYSLKEPTCFKNYSQII